MNKNLKQIAVPLVSVLLGLVLGAIIMWAFSYDALWGYELLFKKAFGSIKSWGNIDVYKRQARLIADLMFAKLFTSIDNLTISLYMKS